MADYRAESAIQVGNRKRTPPQGRDLLEPIIELREAELDEVYGGLVNFSSAIANIRQNARGGDSLAAGGFGGNARATDGEALGGLGGEALSGLGGAGGGNSFEVVSRAQAPVRG